MKPPTLAARLLFAFGFVAVVSTASVGLWVRAEMGKSEANRFRDQIERTRRGLRVELTAETQAVQALLHPLCAHDAFVDKTWVDLKAGRLSSGRRLAIEQLVQEETKALRLDELVLLREDGYVLGAGKHVEWIGTSQPQLARWLEPSQAPAAVKLPPSRLDASGHGAVSVIGQCTTSRGNPRIGLIGSRNLAPILRRLGSVYGVRIALADSPDAVAGPDEVATPLTLDSAPTLRLVVFNSRAEMQSALQNLNRVLVFAGLLTVAGALIVALFLARSLASPLALLAEQVRTAVSRTPSTIESHGSPEVRTVAEAFNTTMKQLARAQRRQAAMERIAAWREVARQVAHEIKNPLTPIRTSIETLRRLKARNDPKFDSFFEQATPAILEQVHRIASIASGFSKFAKLPQPNMTSVDLSDVARSIVAVHENDDVPVRLETTTCAPIQADRDQLAQVLTNLIQNGMDAAREHTSHLTHDRQVLVRVSCEQPDWAVLEVHDSGPGISQDSFDKVFQPYFTTKQHGSGLGLSIVQRIIVEHGGEILIERSHLGGAAFIVRLPAANATELRPNSSRASKNDNP